MSRGLGYLRDNHLALIALVVAVIGVPTAWALGRNSVKSKQIKNGAVLGKDVRDETLKGADVDESSLGQVPAALSAATAGSAKSADSAGGISFERLSAARDETQAGSAVAYDRNGVRITLACGISGAFADAVPTTAGTVLIKSAVRDDGTSQYGRSDDPGTPVGLGSNAFGRTQGTLMVRNANHLAVIDYSVVSKDAGFGTSDDCFLHGIVRVTDL